MNALTKTDYHFPGQTKVYHGKVRDCYFINDEYMVMVATDRISAFDVILPKGIPYKGQVLNQIAAMFLDATADIVPNWKLATPDPMVTVGRLCKPFPIEMIIRGYLTGSSWRTYKSGQHTICGVQIPDGMKEHQRFAEPIITPTTKAEEGHDEDISREEIIAKGLISEKDYAQIEDITRKLFQRGTEIDEIHTPDSSRYFIADQYEERFAKGEPQVQLSKEFVREWLMANGFQGKEGQQVPEMTPEYVNSVSERYIELYEKVTGHKFEKAPDSEDLLKRIENNVLNYLKL